MRDMKFSKLFAVLVLPLVILGVFTGCRDKHLVPQIEFVPDTAVSVRVINLRYLMKSAGIGSRVLDGHRDESAETLFDLCFPFELRNSFVELGVIGGGLDLTNIYGLTTSHGYEVLMAPVADRSAFLARLGVCPDVQEIKPDGAKEWNLRYFRMDDVIVAMGDDYCWFANDVETVHDVLLESAVGHMGDVIGVRHFLENPSPVKIAVNSARSPIDFIGGRDKWLCVGFDVSDTSVSSDVIIMDDEGRVDSIGANFEEIDTDFLHYTPSDASVVLAYGKFDGNKRGLAMLLGKFAPMYVSQASGTTSLYALPASGNAVAVRDAVPGAWNVETMVQVPDDVLQAGVRSYRHDAPSAKYADGQWAYADGDATYYFGGFDGALVFSTNREISSGYTNDFLSDFEGKRLMMLVDIPAGSVLAKAWSVPFGVHFRMGVDERRLFARVTFSGSGRTALGALLELPQIHDVKARFDANLGR